MTIPGYRTEEAQAERLGTTVRTLRLWRQQGIGPAWIKAGKKVLYSEDSDVRWLKSLEQQPVRQRKRA
jgi:DNA-binding transcriptional MerR regulator